MLTNVRIHFPAAVQIQALHFIELWFQGRHLFLESLVVLHQKTKIKRRFAEAQANEILLKRAIHTSQSRYFEIVQSKISSNNVTSCYLTWANSSYSILGRVLGRAISFPLRGLLSDFKLFPGPAECVPESARSLNSGAGTEAGRAGRGLLEKSSSSEPALLLKLENCWLTVFPAGFTDAGLVGSTNCWYRLVNDVKADCGLFGPCFYGNKKA